MGVARFADAIVNILASHIDPSFYLKLIVKPEARQTLIVVPDTVTLKNRRPASTIRTSSAVKPSMPVASRTVSGVLAVQADVSISTRPVLHT